MNKKIFTSAMAVAALAVSFTSCDNSNKQPEAAAPAQNAPTELKIGYVEVDSIMSQYQYCKDYTLILEKKSQNIQSTLQSKGAALQNAAANFQQKLQQNAYTEQQARQIQAGLQKQQADLEGLQQRLGAEFQSETEKFNNQFNEEVEEQRVNDILFVYLNEDGVDKAWDEYGTELYGMSEQELNEIAFDILADPFEV